MSFEYKTTPSHTHTNAHRRKAWHDLSNVAPFAVQRFFFFFPSLFLFLESLLFKDAHLMECFGFYATGRRSSLKHGKARLHQLEVRPSLLFIYSHIYDNCPVPRKNNSSLLYCTALLLQMHNFISIFKGSFKFFFLLKFFFGEGNFPLDTDVAYEEPTIVLWLKMFHSKCIYKMFEGSLIYFLVFVIMTEVTFFYLICTYETYAHWEVKSVSWETLLYLTSVPSYLIVQRLLGSLKVSIRVSGQEAGSFTHIIQAETKNNNDIK